MKITKLGHCCLFIETGQGNILTDPGTYTTAQDSLTGVDIILITHEHADHLHIDSVQNVLANNPEASVVCNSAVGKLLAEAGVAHEILEGGDAREVKGVALVAHDCKHEEIFEDFGQVQNTGYLIADTLFYPGDAFAAPEREIEILALPVAGPWCKIGDALRYCITVKPKKVFPVHDAQLKESALGFMHGLVQKILAEKGIEFTPMTADNTVVM